MMNDLQQAIKMIHNKSAELGLDFLSTAEWLQAHREEMSAVECKLFRVFMTEGQKMFAVV
jgi:hypothetical protein